MTFLRARLIIQSRILLLLSVHPAQRRSWLNAQCICAIFSFVRTRLAMCESLGFEVSSRHSWQPISLLPSALVRRHAWRTSGWHTWRASHTRRWEWHTSGRRSRWCASGLESGRHALRNMRHSGHTWRVLDCFRVFKPKFREILTRWESGHSRRWRESGREASRRKLWHA